MDFTQHQLHCVVRLQRAWRLSFQYKTTPKLLLEMGKMGIKSSQLNGLR